MNIRKFFQIRLLWSFFIFLALWTILSWPLPRYVHRGLPTGCHKRILGPAPVTPTEPGDQLQLLYHFWLFKDMMIGKIDFFHNPYEFNLNNEEELYTSRLLYLPFSFVYAVVFLAAGHALAWNLTGFLSLWLMYYFTWLLLRRMVRHEAIACAVSLVAVAFPFVWINVSGGSPTGFSLLWAPLLMLGIDMAVREDKILGGLLAGMTMVLAALADPHVFFFLALFIPPWCLAVFIHRPEFEWKRFMGYLKVILALLPLVLLAIGALYLAKLGVAANIEQSGAIANEGRTWDEIAKFAAQPFGLFSQRSVGIHAHLYIGYLAVAIVLMGLVRIFYQAVNREVSWRNAIMLLLLTLGFVFIICLALGPYGPFEGLVFRAARKFIPKYNLIRQPAKVLCLMPAVLAVAGAMAMRALMTLFDRKWARIAMVLALTGLWLHEYRRQTSVSVSLLDQEQAAYSEVRADADKSELEARALVLPLWPGDSHFTSLYQYYASLYRIKLANGYRPFVPWQYIKEFIEFLPGANTGELNDKQLDTLRKSYQIHYLLLHENMFPEKTNPFPVTLTLKKLLNHPRLTLLPVEGRRREGSVWAFRIEEQPRENPAPVGESWDLFFPTRHPQAEAGQAPVDAIRDDASAAQGKCVALRQEEEVNIIGPVDATPAPDLHWLARLKGQGQVIAEPLLDAVPVGRETLVVEQTNAWTWFRVPFEQQAFTTNATLRLSLDQGEVQVDMAQLAAGPWSQLEPGQTVTIAAPAFFHNAYIVLSNQTVVFEMERCLPGVVMYGPKLPLPPGVYEATLHFTSPAKPGTLLGQLVTACPEARALATTPVVAGQPVRSLFRLDNNLPMLSVLDQHYLTGDIVVSNLTYRRLE